MEAKNKGILLIVSGLIAGAVNGFFGGGGGMVVVPLLVFLCSYGKKNAHATALSVILPVSVISGVIYILNGDFDFSVFLPTAIGLVVGGGIGALLLKKMKESFVSVIFILLVFAAGVKLAFF